MFYKDAPFWFDEGRAGHLSSSSWSTSRNRRCCWCRVPRKRLEVSVKKFSSIRHSISPLRRASASLWPWHYYSAVRDDSFSSASNSSSPDTSGDFNGNTLGGYGTEQQQQLWRWWSPAAVATDQQPNMASFHDGLNNQHNHGAKFRDTPNKFLGEENRKEMADSNGTTTHCGRNC